MVSKPIGRSLTTVMPGLLAATTSGTAYGVSPPRVSVWVLALNLWFAESTKFN